MSRLAKAVILLVECVVITALVCQISSMMREREHQTQPAQSVEQKGDTPSDDYSALCDVRPPDDFNQIIVAAGQEFDVNPRVIALTIWRESSCDAHALGSSGEIGLMQINPSVWTSVLNDNGFSDLAHPADNVRAGTWILKRIKARGYSAKSIIRRYNGSGPRARRYADEQVQTYREIWNEKLEV